MIKSKLLLVFIFLLIVGCSSEQELVEPEDNFLEIKVSLAEIIEDKAQIQAQTDFDLASVEVELESTTGKIKRETKAIDDTAELSFRFAELELDSWELSVLVKDQEANIIYSASETIKLKFGKVTKTEINPKLNTVNLKINLPSEGITGQLTEKISEQTIELTGEQESVEFKDLKPYTAYLVVATGEKEAEEVVDILPGRDNSLTINIDETGISID